MRIDGDYLMKELGAMRKVHHVGITVTDLDASIAFYHGILGLQFSVAPTSWFEGAHLAAALGVDPPVSLRVALFEVGDGETVFELLQYRSPRSGTTRALAQNNVGAAHVAFHVMDIRARMAELATKGVPFKSEVNVINDGPLAGWRWVYFTDPDGYTMELVEVAYVNDEQRRADIELVRATGG